MFRNYFILFIPTIIISFILLFVTGVIFDSVSVSHQSHASFFEFWLQTVELPFWFLSALAMLMFNGIFLVKNASISASLSLSPESYAIEWSHHVFRLLGGNMILIVAIMILFSFIRNM